MQEHQDLLLNRNSIGYLICILLVVSSCVKDKLPPSIDEKAKVLVAQFVTDANTYGYDLDVNNLPITLEFGRTDSSNIRATCFTSSSYIIIDSIDWGYLRQSEKEWLIYHELGHCLLRRPHFSEVFLNQECKSIMNENFQTESCHSNLLTSEWSSFYKRELFTNDATKPAWYQEVSLSPTITDTIILVDTFMFDDRLSYTINPNLLDRNFFLSAQFSSWQENEPCISLDWDNNRFVVCTDKQIRISRNVQGPNFSYTEFYHKKKNIQLNDESTNFTILKKDIFFYFYFNSQLVHVMDSGEITEGRFRSNSFDDSLKIQLSLFNIE